MHQIITNEQQTASSFRRQHDYCFEMNGEIFCHVVVKCVQTACNSVSHTHQWCSNGSQAFLNLYPSSLSQILFKAASGFASEYLTHFVSIKLQHLLKVGSKMHKTWYSSILSGS